MTLAIVLYMLGSAVTALLYARHVELQRVQWEDIAAIILWPATLTVLVSIGNPGRHA